MEGGLGALCFVTANLGASNVDNLKDQLTPECMEQLKVALGGYTDTERSQDMRVPQEDVFFDWVARASQKKDGTVYIIYAAMSMPKWGDLNGALKKLYEFLRSSKSESKNGYVCHNVQFYASR